MYNCGPVPTWLRHTELGTRQQCWDNVAIFSGNKTVIVIALCQHLMLLLHLETETLTFFEFFLVPQALLRCRVVFIAKTSVACPALFRLA